MQEFRRGSFIVVLLHHRSVRQLWDKLHRFPERVEVSESLLLDPWGEMATDRAVKA